MADAMMLAKAIQWAKGQAAIYRQQAHGDTRAAALDALVEAVEAMQWKPISEAKKNGTAILAKFYGDIYPRIEPRRSDLATWNGRYAVIKHNGLADDGFDIGWMVAAPVGCGGLSDEWIEGWMPLPSPEGT
jgi:hypothetical protein